MATIESLVKEMNTLIREINTLRKENHEIKKRLSSLENNSNEEIEAPKIKEVETPSDKRNKKSSSVLGPVLIVVGLLLCFTVIGAIIGIPLIIAGIIITTKSSKERPKNKTIPPQNTKEHEHHKKIQNTLEADIGLKWFARIGILALVIGVGFFIKYAIDNNWINHLTRIILGTLFGIILIIAGEIISKKEKYANWAKTLVGGGFAITYFMMYAAYHFQEYRQAIGITLPIDILLLSIVVLIAIILSLKDDSQIIAGEAFLLGFITSLLSQNFETITLIYGLLLAIGLATVTAYKKWEVLGISGAIATYLLYIIWASDKDSFTLAAFFLTASFIIFTIQSFFIKEGSTKGVAITLINSLFFYTLLYSQLDHNYSEFRGVFTITLALVYFAVSYMNKLLENNPLSITNLYLALLFTTLAVPIELNKEWVTIIWALEALILSAISVKLDSKTTRISSYFVGFFTACKTLIYDTRVLHKIDFANLLNSTRLFSFIATIICFYAVYIILKNSKTFPQEEKSIPKIYSSLATFFLILIIFLELQKHQVWITLILSAITLIFVFISRIKNKETLYASFAIIAILASKVLFYDSWNLSDFNFNDILSSTRTISFTITILALYIIAAYLEKNKEHLKNEEKIAPILISYLATALAFAIILIEMKEFLISVGWIILALTLTIIGFAIGKKHLRIQGMLIFGITIVKVFLYDTRNLDTLYRTVSYIALGIILLLVSLLYTKYKDHLKEIIKE